MQAHPTMKAMRSIVETLKRDPKRKYTLAEIQAMRMMPWAKNGRTIRKILDADRSGPNLLKSKITGTASQRRYLVEGRHLISYLQEYGPGLMALVRKPKHTYEPKKRDSRKGAAH